MPKGDARQLLTCAGRDDSAFEAILLQANFDTVFGQNKQGLIRFNQGVFQFWMDIERLVGRKCPGCGGPDHNHPFFLWQMRDTKCFG